MAIPIIATKLRPPIVTNLVPRAALTSALMPGPGVRLTLVTGGAGYGKTSLLADLVSTVDKPVVWYKLDASDRDPVRFLAYLIRGTQLAAPGLLDRLDAMLAGAGADAYREKQRLFRAFLAEIGAYSGAGLIYVLDDFHEVEKSRDILALTELLIDLMPQNIHVCIATREEPRLPLGRLRAQGRLLWLRADDLRFTPGEIEELFSREGVGLEEGDLGALTDLSEGWVAGLVLLREAWRHSGSEGRAEIVAKGGLRPALQEFLSKEIFERQSAEMQEFLLVSSLADPLLPEMCDQVSGRGKSAALLEAAATGHLMTSRLEGPEPAYRYHPLFRDFLQERLQRHSLSVTDLHRRWGSAWETEQEHVQAIRHYLAAEDDRAFELMEKVAEDFLQRGQAETVDYWLSRATEETLASRPRLQHIRGLTLNYLGRLKESIVSLDRATEGFISSGDTAGAYETRHLSSHTSLSLGDWRTAVKGCGEALGMAPDVPSRVRSRTLLGCAFLLMCDWNQAIRHWNEAVAEAENGHPREKARAIGFLAALYEWQGDFRRACELVQESLCLLENSADTVHYVRLLNNFAFYLGETARYGRARRLGVKCLELCETNYFVQDKADVLDTLGQIELSTGSLRGLARLEEALELMKAYGNPVGEAITLGNLGLYYRREGDLPRALHLLTSACTCLAEESVPYHLALQSVELARVMWLEGRRREADALRSQVEQLCRKHSLRHIAFRLKLHGAQEALAEGLTDQALALSARALGTARRYQYNDYLIQEGRRNLSLFAFAFERGVEVSYLCYLLEKMGRDAVVRIPALARAAGARERLALVRLLGRLPGEAAAKQLKRYLRDGDAEVRRAAKDAFRAAPGLDGGDGGPGPISLEILTPKEVEILQVAARGLSNREVGEQLFLSEATVKTHLKRIYQKLQVGSRSELSALAGRLEKSPESSQTQIP